MMKKTVLLAACLVAASTVRCAVQPDNDTLLDRQQFLEGFQAGTVAGVGVDLLRQYVLPSLETYKLHDNYGICRDQLTGEAKVAAALLLSVYLNGAPKKVDVRKLGSKLLGVVTGACTASVATKVVASLLK